MLSLEKLVQQARQDGWACVEGRIDSVLYQVNFLGWVIVPSRKGGLEIDLLKPQAPEEAPKHSLSAMVGLGAQPLHTDGAHHIVPPDVILLSADAPSHVPTSLWRLPTTGLASETTQDLRHGLFTVRTGRDAFLAPVLDRGRVRFDPGCMTPSDSRSRRVVDFLAAASVEPQQHDWTTSDLILAIDNRRVLHARGAAGEEPERSMRRIALRIPEEKQ